MPAIAATRAFRAIPRISSLLVATAALFAAHGACATKLIARYTFSEASGPTRNDSAGTNTAATEIGNSGFLYETEPVEPGDYGDLTVGETQLGPSGGLGPSAEGVWATAGNNELGALTNDFTVMAWVKLEPGDFVNRQRIIGRSFFGGSGGGWSFGIDGGGELLLTRVGAVDVDVVTSAPAITAGSWYHVAVTKSSSTGITFVVNGLEVENFPAETGPWASSTAPWNLLARDVDLETLSGVVDDIRVYDGALDAKGIREALEFPGGLFAHYSFGEPRGPVRFDWSDPPRNATEEGSPSNLIYGAAPIPADTYGSLTIAGNTFGANGGQSTLEGVWTTQPNTRLGSLTTDFTVMAWVKPDNTFARQRIIGRTFNGTGGWGFGLDGAGFIFTGYGVIDAVSAATPIVANTWQHLAATLSSAAGVSFYLNGDLVERQAGLTGLWQASTDAWSLLGATELMTGKVDEVRVYQGVLDTQQIRDVASGYSCRNRDLALGVGSGNAPFDELSLTDEDLIEDLNVTVDLSYARVGDMNLVLKHVKTDDTQTTITLITTPAGPGGIGTCNGSDMLVTLDDSAENFADDECAAARPTIKGAFKPSQPLSKFNGETLAGTWRISIEDAEGQGIGNLFRWCLQTQKSSLSNRILVDSFE